MERPNQINQQPNQNQRNQNQNRDGNDQIIDSRAGGAKVQEQPRYNTDDVD